jgi:heme/copper-type cytochrome/quinol oxidase subunit 3
MAGVIAFLLSAFSTGVTVNDTAKAAAKAMGRIVFLTVLLVFLLLERREYENIMPN